MRETYKCDNAVDDGDPFTHNPECLMDGWILFYFFIGCRNFTNTVCYTTVNSATPKKNRVVVGT